METSKTISKKNGYRFYGVGIRLVCFILVVWAAFPAWSATDPLVEDPVEQELLNTLRSEKLIRTRERAEKILRQKPHSIIARYALAVAFHDEEANLPRALYHIRQAEEQFTRRFGLAPTQSEIQTWLRRLLEEEEELLGEMDRREEQLAVIDRYNAHFSQKLNRRRIWPLIKLHRFAEAKQIAQKLALSEDILQRISGHNGLLTIESEQLRPQQCFTAGMKGIEATGYQSCILLENTAEAAFTVFEFSEAERLAIKALQAKIKDCPASAHPHLANLYLLRGDFQRAMAAIQSARQYGIQRRFRQQFEMGNAAWLARLLYSLGQFKSAYELTKQIIRAPDRVGMTSFSADLMRVIGSVDHYAALTAYLEELREKASIRSWGAWLKQQREIMQLLPTRWVNRYRADRLLAQPQMLTELVRPYFKPLPPWNAGALISVAGSGTVIRAVREARQRETMPGKTAAYFDSLEGEATYRSGDHQRAWQLGQQAIKALPGDETLLRARVAAWTAHVAWMLGKPREAETLYHQVLNRFPTALRFLGIPLPVQIRHDKQPLSDKIAKLLYRSRRLTQGNLGFSVNVRQEGKTIHLCLNGHGNIRYSCTNSDWPASGTEADRMGAILDEFHRQVFAPKIDLTQHDINTLDGSAVRGDADQLLKQVLGK